MRLCIIFLSSIFLQFFSYGTSSCQSFTEEFIAKSRTKSSIAEYKNYLSKTVDTKYITKFSLGSNWRSLSPEQRKKFYEIYSQYIISKYSLKFAKYPSISHTITEVKDDERRKNICQVKLVITTMVNGEKKDFPLGAIVANEDGEFKIQDITFENVSMLQTHKQEISSLIETKGFDGTIAILKDYIISEK
ncbi:MAG: ABC transporter substrate-binding protein [Proteobacteria bacterium]|nr:ABC transporter substrate-binding protein [Pseudomonadota bacterium]